MSDDKPVSDTTFLAFEEDLQLIEDVKKRLYREERLDGDRQRDMAHKLNEVLRRIRQCPWKEPER